MHSDHNFSYAASAGTVVEFVNNDKQFCSKGAEQMAPFNTRLTHILSPLSTDHFVGFGKYLGKDEAELGKVWDEALGRYDRAVLKLVVDVLQEAQNPEEKLCNALSEMRTPESAKRAAAAIQNGKLSVAL